MASDLPNSAFGVTRLSEAAFVRQVRRLLRTTQAKTIYASAGHKATVTMGKPDVLFTDLILFNRLP